MRRVVILLQVLDNVTCHEGTNVRRYVILSQVLNNVTCYVRRCNSVTSAVKSNLPGEEICNAVTSAVQCNLPCKERCYAVKSA